MTTLLIDYFPGWGGDATNNGYTPDPAWTGSNTSPWAPIPAERQPLTGAVNEDNQQIIDMHLEAAGRLAATVVFRMCWYRDFNLLYALQRMLASKSAATTKVDLMWDNAGYARMSSTACTREFLFEGMRRAAAYMGSARYWKRNGKPVLEIYSTTHLDDVIRFSSGQPIGYTPTTTQRNALIADMRNVVANYLAGDTTGGISGTGINAAVSTAANPGAMFLVMHGVADSVNWAPIVGIDANADYNNHNVVVSGGTVVRQAHTWEELRTGCMQLWSASATRASSNGKLYFPPAMGGFNKAPWGGDTSDPSGDLTPPTKAQFDAHMTEFLAVTNAATAGNTGSFYAWDEFGEGSAAVATQRDGSLFQDSIKSALSMATNAVAQTRLRPPFALSSDGRFYSNYPNGDKFAAAKPVIYATSCPNAPTNTLANGNGGYLTIVGRNFSGTLGTNLKVFIGSAEVAKYLLVETTFGGVKTGWQAIHVQLGNLGGLAVGAAAAVTVVSAAGTSNADIMFTPSGGRVLYCSHSGSNTTGVPNDITKPFRTLQNVDGSDNITWCIGGNGAIGSATGPLRAGDQVVIRGDAIWNDTGKDTAWFRFRYSDQQGSPNKWVQFYGYPGEGVHYVAATGKKGSIAGAEGGTAGTTGDYVACTNIESDGAPVGPNDGCPFNSQSSRESWRVTNCKGSWKSTVTGANHAKGGLYSGHASNTKVIASEAHDFYCVSASENHGIYFDSPDSDSSQSNFEVMGCWIHDNTGGNSIQFYDNLGAGGSGTIWGGFKGCKVHHNWIEVNGKYGINVDTNMVSIDVWNNVIIGSTYAPFRWNISGGGLPLLCRIWNNTCYNNDRFSSGSGNGQVLNSNNYANSGTITFSNNLFIAGPNTFSGSLVYSNNGGIDSFLKFSENAWFAYNGAQSWTSFSRDAKARFLNPLFTNAGSQDFTLQPASPYISASTLTPPSFLVDDFIGTARPQGASNDLGAYESVAA